MSGDGGWGWGGAEEGGGARGGGGGGGGGRGGDLGVGGGYVFRCWEDAIGFLLVALVKHELSD